MDTAREARSVKSLSRHTLEQMVTLCSEGILLADARDPSYPVVYTNPAYEDLSGYTTEELTGSPWQLAKRDGDGQPELARLKAAIGRAEPCQVTLPDLRKDGTPWLCHVCVEPLYNARGELRYLLCIQRPAPMPVIDSAGQQAVDPQSVEVTLLQRELGRAQQKIQSMDRIDPATGLLRFGYFQDLLQRDIAIARRDQRVVTLLVFEIVDFDAYRRTFGSKSADSCQRMIGAQITRTLRRAGDLCTRYDASTLVASVLGQQAEEVRGLADQIGENVRRLGLHNPRAKSGRYVTVQSVVVACPPGTTEDPETLIVRAQADLRSRMQAATAESAATS
jgi:diguanylate cyclase (GGDEF)-like protein/PAS domain S-box-containing protein